MYLEIIDYIFVAMFNLKKRYEKDSEIELACKCGMYLCFPLIYHVSLNAGFSVTNVPGSVEYATTDSYGGTCSWRGSAH